MPLASLLTAAGRVLLVDERPVGGPVVVWAIGELDSSTDGAPCRNLARAIACGDQRVLVDLSHVWFMGASTSRLLVLTHEYLQERSRALVARSPSRQVRRVLVLCDRRRRLVPSTSAVPEKRLELQLRPGRRESSPVPARDGRAELWETKSGTRR